MREHQNTVGRLEFHATVGEESLEVPADATAESAPIHVVTLVKPRNPPERSTEPREVVDVDEPVVVAVRESVAKRCVADVVNLPDDQRGDRGQVDVSGYHVAPSRFAASTPDLQPSS